MQSYFVMVRSGGMDKMREEKVTKEIIKKLKQNDWFIFSFDFPQSGTGCLILPDNSNGNKNKDSIIPDIIAIKNNVCVFFENKDRIVVSDFDKVNSLITNNLYINNINKLLKNYNIKDYYYGIGLPDNINLKKLDGLLNKTDFVLLVKELNYQLVNYYDKYNLFN